MFVFTVYTSHRYIDSGSFMPPIGNAGIGLVGPRITSHFSNARSNSSLMSRRTWSARL